MILHLRTNTEQALCDALPYFMGVAADGRRHLISASHDYALALLGPVIVTPATFNQNGDMVTPPVVDDRFHANLALYNAELEVHVPADIRITCTTPSVVFL